MNTVQVLVHMNFVDLRANLRVSYRKMETKKTCHAIAAIATVCQVDLQNGRKRKANSKGKQEVGHAFEGF